MRVAREAFSQLGYAGASMGDIAARAGIRKSSLFHHFATKDELYREALQGVIADLSGIVSSSLVDVVAAASNGANGANGAHGTNGTNGANGATGVAGASSFRDRFSQSTRAMQEYLGKNPVAARLLLREFVDGGNALAQAGEAVDGLLKMSQQVLERAMLEGIIPKQDTRQLVMSTAGIHLLFFALPEVTSRLFGTDVFGAELVEARCVAALEHVRRVIGAQ